MKTPDRDVIEKVKKWLTYADEDLRLAQHGLTLETACPHRLIAYHAQQCAEKHLKAYLVYHGVDFPYTHNVARLLELCSEQADWARTLEDAEELTPFAITARYPGEEEEVAQEEAIRAIHIATHVRRVVRNALSQEGMKLPDPFAQ